MTSIEIPAYVDPAVLVPGQRIYAQDGTVLTVHRVEPALICLTDDGRAVTVLAHTVIPVDSEAGS